MTLRDDYVAAVEAENETLRGRILMLEEILGMRLEVPLEFGLTPQETKLFGFLLQRDLITKEAAMVVLYGGRPDGDDAVELQIVDVFVCKIRGKLKRFGISIETVWGQGYRLTAEAKAAATALLPKTSEAA